MLQAASCWCLMMMMGCRGGGGGGGCGGGVGQTEWGWFTHWLTSQLPSRRRQIGPNWSELAVSSARFGPSALVQRRPRAAAACGAESCVWDEAHSNQVTPAAAAAAAGKHLARWVRSNFSRRLKLALLSERAAAVTRQLQSS